MKRVDQGSLQDQVNRGRDARNSAPPAQNRTSGFPAYGSHLGCLTAKRCSGQGCRIRGFGRKSSASRFIRSPVVLSRWPRRRSERNQSRTTQSRKVWRERELVGTA